MQSSTTPTPPRSHDCLHSISSMASPVKQVSFMKILSFFVHILDTFALFTFVYSDLSWGDLFTRHLSWGGGGVTAEDHGVRRTRQLPRREPEVSMSNN